MTMLTFLLTFLKIYKQMVYKFKHPNLPYYAIKVFYQLQIAMAFWMMNMNHFGSHSLTQKKNH